jgi:extradiol dioxygenase family protein
MPEQTVRNYYAALRAGDPLGPFFAGREDVVKVGISERLVGHDAVTTALGEQTERTADWAVQSHELRVRRRGPVAWFSDWVDLEWTDTERGVRFAFETRWSGTLERPKEGDDRWQFAGMHVSAPRRF